MAQVAICFMITLAVCMFLAMKRFHAQGWIVKSVKFLFKSGIDTVFFVPCDDRHPGNQFHWRFVWLTHSMSSSSA
ncbi:MAG TPA: hypothetical protein VMJ73_06550, partial [Rhizomicrobium sp.]|nr:hypothetical protein [Rhizomicrobium sp.]